MDFRSSFLYCLFTDLLGSVNKHMKQECKDEEKNCLKQQLALERKRQRMPQTAFARALDIDVRSYIALEHGDSLCGTMTLIIFLTTICPDPLLVLGDLKSIIQRHKISKPRSS